MTIDELNSQILGTSLAGKAAKLAEKKKQKETKFGYVDQPDADSNDYYRLLGGDSPEVFHNITPTGDTNNERKKVYEQYAYMNNIPLEQAITEVDNQGEAYKNDLLYRNSTEFQIDKILNPNDSYYNDTSLGQTVAAGRKAGDVTGDMTSFDIYNAGEEAYKAALLDKQQNPETAFDQYTKFDTGEKGFFDRNLVDNKEFVNRQLQSGMMIPGANDATEYAKQLDMYNNAVLSQDSNIDPRVRDAIFQTSYNQKKLRQAEEEGFNPAKWEQSNSNLIDAVQHSFGRFGANTADTIADGLLRVGKEVYKANTGKSEKEVNELVSDAVQGTFAAELLDKNANFIGMDKYKTAKEYGYDNTNVKEVTKELKNAFANGTFTDQLGALLKTPTVALEVLANSSAEIVAAASGIGTVAIFANAANDVLEERAKIKGTTDLSLEDYSIAYATGTAYALVNKLSAGNYGLKMFKDDVAKLATKMKPKEITSLGKMLVKATGTAGKAYIGEGLEEVIQDAVMDIGNKLATVKEDEILNADKRAELFASFGLGGAGGMAGSSVKVAIDTRADIKQNRQLKNIVSTVENLSKEDVEASKEFNQSDIEGLTQVKTVQENLKKDLETVLNNKSTDGSTLLDLNDIVEKYSDTIPELKNVIESIDNEAAQRNKVTINNIVKDTNNPKQSTVVDKIYGETIKELVSNEQAVTELQSIVGTDVNANNVVDFVNTAVDNGTITDLTNYLTNNSQTFVRKINSQKSVRVDTAPMVSKAVSNVISNIDNTVAVLNDSISTLEFKGKTLDRAVTSKQERISTPIGNDVTQNLVNTKWKKDKVNKLKAYDTATLEDYNKQLNSNNSAERKISNIINTILSDRKNAETTTGFNISSIDSVTDTVAKLQTQPNADARSILTAILKAKEIKYTDDVQMLANDIDYLEQNEAISPTVATNFRNRLNKISKNATTRPVETKEDTAAKDTETTEETTGFNAYDVKSTLTTNEAVTPNGEVTVANEVTLAGYGIQDNVTLDDINALLDRMKSNKICK